MSLKWFHLFFISTSIGLTVVVAAWALQHAQWLLAVGSLAVGTTLFVYRGAFLRKAREVNIR